MAEPGGRSARSVVRIAAWPRPGDRGGPPTRGTISACWPCSSTPACTNRPRGCRRKCHAVARGPVRRPPGRCHDHAV